MITAQVTAEQLAEWRALTDRHRSDLTANRISGVELDRYFVRKYRPHAYSDARFVRMLEASAREYGSRAPEIAGYVLCGEIYVGIDRRSGWFHVECADIARAVPVWDDLFLTRGLNADDLQNVVLTGQYLQLSGRGGETDL